MGNFLLSVGGSPDMEKHHLPDQVADMSARVSIVADVGDTVGRERFRTDGENAVAHRIGYPGINAVRNDVVERLTAWGEFHQIQFLESDIVQ